MSLLDRLAECARFDASRYRPFSVAGHDVGRMTAETAALLGEFSGVFAVSPAAVWLNDALKTPAARTGAVAKVLETLRERGVIKGWRGERYPVSRGFAEKPLFEIERAAVPMFGSMGYGVHLNGFVRRPGGIAMWIGKRAMSKPTGPGKLDQMVGGGHPVGLGVRENMIKECAEEAGIPSRLAKKARPAGTVSYLTERLEGLRHDILFVFDLELPADFKPKPIDGEVDAFYLWPMAKVLHRLKNTADFKFNAALVIIDFAVRHGLLSPDDSGYVTVTERLRMGFAGPLSVR